MAQRKASKRPFRTLYYINGVRVRTGHATTYARAIARAASWIILQGPYNPLADFSTVVEDCYGNALHAIDTISWRTNASNFSLQVSAYGAPQ